jgi:hypothetical protein
MNPAAISHINNPANLKRSVFHQLAQLGLLIRLMNRQNAQGVPPYPFAPLGNQPGYEKLINRTKQPVQNTHNRHGRGQHLVLDGINGTADHIIHAAVIGITSDAFLL